MSSAHPYRTRGAGTLTTADIGTEVTLSGWVARRRDHGGLAFYELRDGSGLVQVVVNSAEADIPELRSEDVVTVSGVVRARPDGNANPDLPTGEIEVPVANLKRLSAAAPLPFQLDERISVGEDTRLRYRYLDLRRSGPARALRLRSEANRVARDLLLQQGFVEVETPTLTRSTPEGARDFVVPARLSPGSWYALPQSPQLFKQLLMVAGLERYFQIARCYRDEDFRADRQPEFTQLDIEMSFVTEADLLQLGEQLAVALWRLIGVELAPPFPRLSYHQAMSRYGSDKPDLRFDLELTDCTDYFAGTDFRVFRQPYVGAVVMPGGASQPRRQLDAWQDWAKQRGAKGLAYVLVPAAGGELGGPIAKNLSESERASLAAHVKAQPGDCIFFAAGAQKQSQQLLGAVRNEIGRRCELYDPSQWSLLWVNDAPLFEPASDAVASGDVAVGSGSWTAVHHAFTAPKPEHLLQLESDPGAVLADAYDLVCNGQEIGGGSIRIHDQQVQQQVFAIMGLSEEQVQEKFGFLLDALAFGAPPHGGIAFGWDRIVAFLAGYDSIREVIAFPKSGGGFDPLTGAPAAITAQQRKEAGVDAQRETNQAKAVGAGA